MLYANENRKKMSQLYPTESNKDISKRLGSGWKCLDEDERKRFFDRAKAIGLQHKREYPGIYYKDNWLLLCLNFSIAQSELVQPGFQKLVCLFELKKDKGSSIFIQVSVSVCEMNSRSWRLLPEGRHCVGNAYVVRPL